MIQQTCLGDLNTLEVNTVHEKSDPNELRRLHEAHAERTDHEVQPRG